MHGLPLCQESNKKDFKNEIQLLASLGNHLEMLKVLKYVSSVCLKRANLYLFAN